MTIFTNNHQTENIKKKLSNWSAEWPCQNVRRPGAVLVIFLEKAGHPHLLFTKRAADLEEHAGQISFPGGALEDGDEDLKAAALRETEEEIGIKASELEILGPLPCQPVLDQWLIYPLVAWWHTPRPLAHNKAEVDQVIISPLGDLYRQHQKGCYLEPDAARSCRYDLNGEILWGATGRITGRLLDYLRPSTLN